MGNKQFMHCRCGREQGSWRFVLDEWPSSHIDVNQTDSNGATSEPTRSRSSESPSAWRANARGSLGYPSCHSRHCQRRCEKERFGKLDKVTLAIIHVETILLLRQPLRVVRAISVVTNKPVIPMTATCSNQIQILHGPTPLPIESRT